ncbi:DnaJ-like subfamily C member 7, partial [Mucuna pruriens]
MSSPAPVHLRSPINSSSDAPPHSPSLHFNADCLNPSAASRTRSRPRLAKLRKQSATQQARSRTRASASAAGDEGAGFNPFRSHQVTGNVSGVESGSDVASSNCHRNDVFVFGAGKGDSGSARDLKGPGEEEIRKSGGVEFVFGAKRSDAESKKNSENVTETVSGEERKVKSNSEGRVFVFGACGSNFVSGSSIEKGKSSVRVGERECKTAFECEKHDCFGSNRSGRESSVNVEKPEPVGCVRSSDHGTGAFGVKMGINGNSDTCAGQADHLGNGDKFNSWCGSIDGISATYCDIPACNLSDEMEKLNIKHSEGAGITRDSTNLHANGCTGFVFGGSDKVSSYSSVGSGTDADGQQSCAHAAFESIGGQFVKNGTACGISSGSTGIHCSKPSTSQEGVRGFQFGQIPECNVSEDSKVNGAAASFSFSSFGLDSRPNYYASMGHSLSADKDKGDDCFASTPEASEESFADFKPPTWDPSCFKDNLLPKLNKKIESKQKGRSCKEKGSKCMRRKLKLHSLNKKQTGQDHLSKENGSVKTPDSSGIHSPMDFSPYQETTTTDQDVKASEELNDPHSTISTDYKDEQLPAVGREDISTPDRRCGDPHKNKLFSRNGSFSVGDFHSSGPEIVWSNLKTNQFCSTSVTGASAEAGVDFTSKTEKQKDDIYRFVHGVNDSKGKDFAFSAASSTLEGTPSLKRKQKKFRRKMGCNPFAISPRVNGGFVSSVQFSPHTTANMSSSDVMDRSPINDQFKEEDVASSDTIPAACDKWRLRGNQAHKDGDLSKAEDFYTLGINSVPSSERSGCRVKPLLLCYSNRAATRMTLGRIREALEDCMMATALDPTFPKIQMRTANCHLLLGEVENAQQCFNKCMESASAVCLDRRVIVEAAEGLQKAQEVVKCINNAAELLEERTSDAAITALELVSKALSISLYSEKLLQMKAEALCLQQKYDAAIQLCEQSQHLAEKNFVLANNAENSDSSLCDSYSSVKLWRWSLISKCYFHLGRLEASLNVLEKLQHSVSVANKCVIDNIEDLLSLASTIRELLDHKRAGNENFKSGKYAEAVENYTAALSCNIKSRPFVAICFCNRAAAHQALGQIADAIADCSVAIALDGNYAKAISRRATLHEMVRDYEKAACDLKKLISVLEMQSNERAKQSDSPSGSNGVKESRQAHQRLLSVEDQAKKGTPLDVYLILGIKSADTATDIKKAYHKAALRHHPDKAGQLLARSEVGDEGRVWKEISQEVYKDADRLFKMIGEAYAVLSDPAKRSEYDLEEEIRKASKLSSRGGTSRRSSDAYGFGRPCDGYKSPSDRSSNRRYGRDHWKTYGHSYSRW